MKNTYDMLVESMQDDDESTGKKSARLLRMYSEDNGSKQAVMDEVLITLCGWSFPTLLNMSKWTTAEETEEA